MSGSRRFCFQRLYLLRACRQRFALAISFSKRRRKTGTFESIKPLSAFQTRCWLGWRKAMPQYRDLVALVENSKTVEPNEFLNAFESMQSRSTTVLLDEASLVRLNRLGRWQVDITSDALGYPGRYVTLARCRPDLVAGGQAAEPIHSQSSIQIRTRPDHFSDCPCRFRNLGSDDRSGNVELRYPA